MSTGPGAFDARDAIAAAIGVPVVTSNQAAFTAALDILGMPAGAREVPEPR